MLSVSVQRGGAETWIWILRTPVGRRDWIYSWFQILHIQKRYVKDLNLFKQKLFHIINLDTVTSKCNPLADNVFWILINEEFITLLLNVYWHIYHAAAQKNNPLISLYLFYLWLDKVQLRTDIDQKSNATRISIST